MSGMRRVTLLIKDRCRASSSGRAPASKRPPRTRRMGAQPLGRRRGEPWWKVSRGAGGVHPLVPPRSVPGESTASGLDSEALAVQSLHRGAHITDAVRAGVPAGAMLGIRAGSGVRHQPPRGFVQKLNPLPDGVGSSSPRQTGLVVILFFSQDAKELVQRLLPASRAAWPDGWHLGLLARQQGASRQASPRTSSVEPRWISAWSTTRFASSTPPGRACGWCAGRAREASGQAPRAASGPPPRPEKTCARRQAASARQWMEAVSRLLHVCRP